MQSEVIDPFHKWFLSLPESRREVLRQDKWGLADAAFNAGREAALSTDVEPVTGRNDEAGYVEFLNEDVPYIVRDIEGRCAILVDLHTRKYIGYRVYDPDSDFGSHGGNAEPVKTAPAVAVPQILVNLATAVLAQAPANATEFMGVGLDDIRSALSAQVQDVAGGAVTITATEYAALRGALKPFAKYAGDPSHIKQRAFLQLLICPLGDEHPDNHVPLFHAALAALGINPEGDTLGR